MHRILIVAVLAITTLVQSCELPPDDQRSAIYLTLAQSCGAYAGALRVLTMQRAAGQLTQEEIDNVDRVNRITDVICAPGKPPADPDEAVATVNSAVASVMSIASSHDVVH
jgi:hypothetical protein